MNLELIVVQMIMKQMNRRQKSKMNLINNTIFSDVQMYSLIFFLIGLLIGYFTRKLLEAKE